MCLYTSIFIEIPSLKGLPTKAKEDRSPHEMRLSPAGHQPNISWSCGIYYYYYYYYYYCYYIIIIIIIITLLLIQYYYYYYCNISGLFVW